MGLSSVQAVPRAIGGEMKTPDRIDLDFEQVEALLQRAKEALSEEDYKIIKSMVETIHLLSQSVDQKAASIRRLLKMLFGDQSEKAEGTWSKRGVRLHGRQKGQDHSPQPQARQPLCAVPKGKSVSGQ